MRNFLIILMALVLGISSNIALAKDDLCMAFNNHSKTTLHVYAGKYDFKNPYYVEPNETVTFSRADMKTACRPAYNGSCAVTVFIPLEGKLDLINHKSLIPGVRIGYFDYKKYTWVVQNVRCVS